MIVCHCNRLTSGDIADSVGCLLGRCERPDLCPEAVYAELDACPRCCNCFPLAEQLIDQSRVAFLSRGDFADLIGDEAGNDADPMPRPLVATASRTPVSRAG